MMIPLNFEVPSSNLRISRLFLERKFPRDINYCSDKHGKIDRIGIQEAWKN